MQHAALAKIAKIHYPPYGSFLLRADNNMLLFRAKTFRSKEPETLAWIASLKKNSLFIDVGANIGIYSIPAAIFHEQEVIAIEPEPSNYAILNTNIQLNKIDKAKIRAAQLAISTKYDSQIVDLFLAGNVPGSSGHQIVNNQDTLLNPLQKDRPSTYAYCRSLKSIVQSHKKPGQEINIKIDVDGIEADVCESLFEENLLNSISSMQIELAPNLIKEHKSLINNLHEKGFTFDPAKTERSRRKNGTNQNFADFVFKNSMQCRI